MSSFLSPSINNIFNDTPSNADNFTLPIMNPDKMLDIAQILKEKSVVSENLSDNLLDLQDELGFQPKLINDVSNPFLEDDNKSYASFCEERKKLPSKKNFVIEEQENKEFDENQERQRELRKKMGVFDEVSILPLTPPPQRDEKFYKYIFDTNYSINQQSKQESSTNNENIQFNFGSMKFKTSQKNLEIYNRSKPSDFFQNILQNKQIKNDMPPFRNPEIIAPLHIDLNNIPIKQNLNYHPLSSKRRGIKKKKDFASKCTTGLRRQSLIDLGILVQQAVTPSKKTTFVNLSKLFEKSPSFGNQKINLMNVVQESMRFLGKDISPQSNSLIQKKNLDDDELSIENHLQLGKRPSEIFEESQYATPIKKKLKKSKTAKKLKKSKKKNNKKKISGCKCSKIKCTRLHCICFREKGYCGSHCGCVGCLNREEYADTIKKIKNFTKEINPLAFKSKIEELNSNSSVKIHNRGCSCSKNNCLKNYCECHKNNLKCSSLCKCEQCENDKVNLSPDQVKNTIKKCSRKKKKFIVSNDQNTIQFESVEF